MPFKFVIFSDVSRQRSCL